MGKFIGHLTAFAGAVGIVFVVYFFLNNLHASKQELAFEQSKQRWLDLELRREIKKESLEDDAERLAHYRNVEMLRSLDATEVRRKKFLEEEVKHGTEEVKELDRQIDTVKSTIGAVKSTDE